MENWGFCTNQSKSPRPVTCHVIGAWQLGAERPSFHGNQACYNGNRHRYHGNIVLTGSHFEYKMVLPPQGGSATQLFTLSLTSILFWAWLFLKNFEKCGNFRGSNMLRYRVIRHLKFNFLLPLIHLNFRN